MVTTSSNTDGAGRLAGRPALITGAGRGIGRAVAELFAAEGAPVMLADMDEKAAASAAEAIQSGGGQASAIAADVRKSDDVKAMVARTVEEFDGLAILVNNAGVGFPHMLAAMTEEQWNTILDTNLKGVFLCTKHALPALTKAGKNLTGGGRIINMASVESLVGAPMLTAYCASKGAVLNYTRACAAELAPLKIRVNCICPNFTDTEMIKMITANAQMTKEITSKTPLGRLGQPDDVAKAAVFLASDDADYITGHHLVVDGGFTIL